MADGQTPDTRRRVLSAIRTAGVPVTVETLSSELALHANTVRFHTAALEEDGLIRQGKQPTGGKGRPRVVYVPTVLGARAGERNFELVSNVLLAQLAATAPDPIEVAREAGHAWGSARAGRSKGRRNKTRLLLDVLDDIGFEPEPVPTRRPSEIRLHNCPFRELVDSHQDLVCSLHAGLIDGLTASNGNGVARSDDGSIRAELQPFATESSCLVHLRRNGSEPG